MFWKRTKIKLLFYAMLFTLIACSQIRNEDEELVEYIAKITASKSPEGNFIILADNGCSGCRKIVQQYSLSHPQEEFETTLIIRDIKTLDMVKDDFWDFSGKLFIDSLRVYEKTDLNLPPAISFSIQNGKIKPLPLDLDI
ncbi:hypothetical protein SAMN03080598_00630 [Algoriphagus boritolerans DSM 17298 = JCM 18970]|uniref:NlpE N-terminal domain-containing protein n=2 Tax=Algoriphagus TaxID=246875 RepID=A0A1H5T153_9BACT|nr:hypothetical protein SAMN03080598_00630 [Algoriphagus boritolerans DSM 17298 = JCM 18970]